MNEAWQGEYSPAPVDGVSAAADPHVMPKRRVSTNFKDRGPRHFIREWRRYRGLTIEKLAERIGSSQPNLSKIERGLVPYSQEMLEALAVELRCEPADLIVRDPSDPDGIWSIWESLAPEQRAQIVAIAKTFKKAG